MQKLVLGKSNKRGLVIPGADTAGGQLIGNEPVPEQAQHLPRDAAWQEAQTARQRHRHRYLITEAVG